MKIINNVDDFKSLKSIDLEDIKTTKINDLKRKDEAKTRIMKYITYKKRTEQEVRKKFKNEIDEQLLDEIIEYLKEANYLDDYQFIQKQVNEYMMLKTLSIRELKYKLLEKGLDKKLVEKYIEDNREELEEYEFEPFFADILPQLKDKTVGIFGSYAWNQGDWIENWKNRLDEAGVKLAADPVKAYSYPDDEALEACKKLGETVAKA